MIFKGINMIYIKARLLASMNNKHMSIQISSLYSINTVIKGEAMIISLHFINKQFTVLIGFLGQISFQLNYQLLLQYGSLKMTTYLPGSKQEHPYFFKNKFIAPLAS